MISYLQTMLAGLRQWITAQKADWNQNDETAVDYIKNRPFYENSIVTYIVPESTVAFSEANGQMVAAWPDSFDAVEGQTYTVSWDGTDYECELTKLNSVPVIPAIGNLSIIGAGPDTGEPFLFMYQNQWGVISNDSASEHVISIKIVTPGEIKTLDEKFLPAVSGLIVKSSTANSTKKFKITVDDNGTISATEVTA